LTEGRAADGIPELLDAFCQRLQAQGRVDRLWLGTTLLHPQTAGYVWIWCSDAPLLERSLGHVAFEKLDTEQDSPARRLRLGAPWVRFREAHREGHALADIEHLWGQGYTDFYGLSVHSRGKWLGAVTLSTRAPEGFLEAQIALLDAVMPALEATLEPFIKDLVMKGLLKAYLGRDAGDRVFHGQVRRGDGETIEAVVWFSDVRGFTRMSAELDRDALLKVLNDTFELLVCVLEDHGGEVLKFMGDGLMGVFPVVDGPAAACRAARAAVSAFRVGLGELSQRRVGEGLAPIEVGVGLHYGDVTYGNIGAPGRLDFTIIGPAVNLASRIEGLCGKLGEPILASEAFVALEGGAWESCGKFEVKGVDAPVAVARPVSASASAGLIA
jgi:adenylate cyclase